MGAWNIFGGGIGGHCVGLITLPPSCVDRLENLGAVSIVQPVQTFTRIGVVTAYLYDPQNHNKSLLTFICMQVFRLSQRRG
jgi:hypothetical protein